MHRMRPWITGALCAALLMIAAPAARAEPVQASAPSHSTTVVVWLHQLLTRIGHDLWPFADDGSATAVRTHAAASSAPVIGLPAAAASHPTITQSGVIEDPDG